MLERRLGIHAGGAMSHVSVHRRGVRPIRFGRNDAEAVLFDQPSRFCCAGTIKFTGAMTSLTQQQIRHLAKRSKQFS
jgi:hypothetical protein